MLIIPNTTFPFARLCFKKKQEKQVFDLAIHPPTSAQAGPRGTHIYMNLHYFLPYFYIFLILIEPTSYLNSQNQILIIKKHAIHFDSGTISGEDQGD